MNNKKAILFVCTGNICRSPMAEGILKDLLKKRGIGEFRVSSAGTWGLEGEGATAYAIEVCNENEIDISSHTPIIVHPANFKRFFTKSFSC